MPPSTRTRWPVRRVATALPVPTTAGIPYSRQTIAVWLMMPPTSDTVAAIRANTGAHDGEVAGQTSTSPGCTSVSSDTCVTTRTGPSTTPGEPPVPRSVLPSPSSLVSHSPTVDVVMPHSITVNGSLTSVGGGPSAGAGSQARSAS